ncbi:Ser-Thr-rich glycosyl-phosphatidyl-inositol-anchored membrane family-domain-containing protein [Xylaria telfairii]|nr:Ser-Thr-rich glycosyl-phosphatidyl-inositol-anchored membrane family-domain-containing protein [Xylaria telfairii]
MRSTIFASILAFAASALAQDATPGYAVISAPSDGQVVASGKTFNIKWSAGKFSGPATISLLGGSSPTTLQVLNPIASNIDVKAETFAWDVACSLGEDKTYGLKIADVETNGATFQYSFPFAIKGPSCNSGSSSSSSSASVSATSSSSATVSATGYPTKGQTTSTKASSYPVETSSSSVSVSTYSNSTTTSVKSYTSQSVTLTSFATQTTPPVYVTETSVVPGSSSAPGSSTTSTPLPTAGAARTGAGLALGLLAAALAL